MSSIIEIDLDKVAARQPRADSPTDRLTLLRKVFGASTAFGWIDPTVRMIVADCQPGFSAETDYRHPIPGVGKKSFGVWCGTAAGARLSAILIRKQAAFERFLTANPQLKGTVITSTWPGALVVWVRVTGPIIPAYVNLGELSWCSNGMIPVGMPETPINHVFVQTGAIPTVAFDALQWTEQERAIIELEALAVEVGPAVRKVGKRRVINPYFWARSLQKNLGITGYDPNLHTFQIEKPGASKVVRLAEGEMIGLIAKGLQGALAASPDHFPAEEIRPSRIQEILRSLQKLVWRPEVTDGEIVDKYLQLALDEHPNSQSTSHELWVGLCAYCRSRGQPLVSEHVFYRLVKPRIRIRFGKRVSHDLNGDRARGYRGLRIKPEFADAIADARAPEVAAKAVPPAERSQPASQPTTS